MKRSYSGCLLVLVVAMVVTCCVSSSAAGFILLVSPLGNTPVIAFAPLDTPTPYRTATLYFTATPYPKSTPYPSVTLYPTSTPWPSPTRTSTPRSKDDDVLIKGDCIGGTTPLLAGNKISVENDGPLDAVVALVPMGLLKPEPQMAAYVRARVGKYYCEHAPEGTFYVYVTRGEDWDSVEGRFTRMPSYHRFREAVAFPPATGEWICFVDITLGGFATDMSIDRALGVANSWPKWDDNMSTPLTVLPDEFPVLK